MWLQLIFLRQQNGRGGAIGRRLMAAIQIAKSQNIASNRPPYYNQKRKGKRSL
jgi:hypothetical protein